MDSVTVTPRKAISSRQETPTSSISQDELKDTMKHELSNNAWMFPATEVAKMLSPKRPKHPMTDSGPYPTLDSFEFLIEQPAVEAAIAALKAPSKLTFHTQENDNYLEIATLLNSCIDNCNTAYEAIHAAPASSKGDFRVAPIKERWLPRLRFNPYDKPTKDGVDGASALKPDLVGVRASQPLDKKDLFCYWSLPSGVRGHYEVEIAGEVKKSWPDMVAQAATYARAQGSSIPLRAFSVLVACNHVDHTLRFLIFHRGGLSASTPLNLDGAYGRLSVQKILLSILLWQTPQDAGIPSFTDGMTFLLPSPEGTPVNAAVTKVFHHALSVRGRNTWVARLETRVQPSAPPARGATLRRSRRPVVLAAYAKAAAATAHPLTVPAAKATRKGTKTPSDPAHSSAPIVVKAFYAPGAKPHFVEPRQIIPKAYAKPDQEGRVFVVKCSWPTRGKREVEPNMYQACGGQFGTPRHLYSFEPCYTPGFPMSNSIFLPPDVVHGARWSVWRDMTAEKPDAVDFRSLCVTVLGDEGFSFENCTDPQDLCECILHAMLGRLVAYQNGYLHRDVSIGNLLKLRVPKECDRFTTKGVLQLLKCEGVLKTDSPSITDGFTHLTLDDEKAGDDEKFWDSLKRAAEGDQSVAEVVEIAHELDRALGEYGVSAECKAIICDGDMAAYIPKYFEDRKYGGDISGTPEFMSWALRDALALNYPCLQTPVDDMYSFFWVTYWAILHPSGSQTHLEKYLRSSIEGSRNDRQAAVLSLSNIVNSRYGHFLVAMAPILRDWYASLDRLNQEFLQIWENHQSDMDSRQKRLFFHRFAYRGVSDFVALSTDCKAIICDGDMAAYIPKYFEDRKYGGDISGTSEFMSWALRDALANNDRYLQSPVDDMHSFFWVALWAILHPPQTGREGRLCIGIEGSRGDRENAVLSLNNVSEDRFGDLLLKMAPLLLDWRASLDRLNREFIATWPKDQSVRDSRQKRLLFHRFAYRGVAEFVAVLAKHIHITVSKAIPTPGSSK